jgi:HD-GYP domain-containing protein (c-di-GMP phosphodiesterase class II)
MDKLIKAIATALDIVEGELLGASTNHGKRIASLSAAMGRYLGLSEEELLSLTSCALLHDNALTEYILAEHQGQQHDPTMRLHCEYGQNNVNALNFPTNIRNIVLYHHEWANGQGPFGKKQGEFPLGAELISIADSLDVSLHLQRVTPEELPEIRETITGNIGKHYTDRAADAMLGILNDAMLLSLKDENIARTADKFIPVWTVDMEDKVILNLSQFIGHIIDYKSEFTRNHSMQIAARAWFMSGYYGYDRARRAELYLAAALHDIGKLATPTDILEKAGVLDEAEFRVIKHHVYDTYQLLKDIDGFEEICDWASNHHEKLDGSGYPFGKNISQLDFNSRLMACLDIYQAVSEPRPYHGKRSHADTMEILNDMAKKGYIDAEITRDLDKTLADYVIPAQGADMFTDTVHKQETP